MDGETWDAEMPAYSASDEDTAAVMTYVRREWGHAADPVSPALVEALREQIRERKTPWTQAELEASAP